jgi:two-component system, NtrC family, response regulator HupR/HoxA
MNGPDARAQALAAGLETEPPLVLVIDDELRSQEAIRRTLDDEFRVIAAHDTVHARRLLEEHAVDIILCDQRMPGETGVVFLREARERWPDAVRVLISGYSDSQDIIAGVNDAGIFQYVLKPWTPLYLLNVVRSGIEARELHSGLRRLDLDLRAGTPVLRRRRDESQRALLRAFDFARLVRASGSPLDAVCRMAERIARYDLSVLILGESGTGKELLARAVHAASPRATGPFVVENCAAIADTLLESELFGHKRGAFTGAVEDHVGLFQRAHGGTVFLDEIGETSPAFQVKLLRVLQEGELRPVGAARAVPVDVRVIAATHRPLEQEVREGRFREDLYYRIAAVTLNMPPLRERPGDILPIAERVLEAAATELGRPPTVLSSDARALLVSYPWPGNIRELRNEITRALALSEGTELDAHALSPRLMQGQMAATPARMPALPQAGTLQERIDALEAMVLREALLRLKWNKTQAAQELGLSRMGLRAKLKRHGLEGDDA